MKKNMYLIAVISILNTFFNCSVIAQEVEPQSSKPPSGNASQIYLELGGPGILYSINYDGRLSKKDKGLGLRVGFTVAYAGGVGYIAVPVGLNYLVGSGGNYFEGGAGASFASTTVKDVVGSGNDGTSHGGGTIGWLSLGYRRQAYRKKGLTWRLAFTPVFGSGTFLPLVAGSLGYRF